MFPKLSSSDLDRVQRKKKDKKTRGEQGGIDIYGRYLQLKREIFDLCATGGAWPKRVDLLENRFTDDCLVGDPEGGLVAVNRWPGRVEKRREKGDKSIVISERSLRSDGCGFFGWAKRIFVGSEGYESRWSSKDALNRWSRCFGAICYFCLAGSTWHSFAAAVIAYTAFYRPFRVTLETPWAAIKRSTDDFLLLRY